MTAAIASEHLRELEERGFSVLRGLVAQDQIDLFEQQIADLTTAQLAEFGLEPSHRDPFIDVFKIGGDYTSRLYKLLERLMVLHRMSADIAETFERAGFFAQAGMKVPLVWPDIRADLPDDAARLLPVHQDYRSMQCRTAYRLWIPLRPSNPELGTMCVYAGSHRQGPVPHELDNPAAPYIAPERYADCERVVFDLPAGDGVLINPLLFHASVPNRSWRTKFTLMVQIQDLATLIAPGNDDFGAFGRAVAVRSAAETGSRRC